MSRFVAALDRISFPHLLVIGDLILDRYTWGNAERVSPEAPVLILRADEEEIRLGGAASVAGLLRALDARVTLAGVIGEDGDGRVLRRLLDEAGIDQTLVLVDPARPTTSKERFMGRAAHRHPQQILRVDREVRQSISEEMGTCLADRIRERMAEVQAVLVSDYAKGSCTQHLLACIIAAATSSGVPVLVDPARITDYRRYYRASALTPNRQEAEIATGTSIQTPSDALAAGQMLRQSLCVETVLVKLDRDGIVLAQSGQQGEIFPTRPRSVYDVTGAGDMVLAMAGLCRASGLPWEEAANLCNVAAGLEVERLGVAPISRGEIRAELVGETSCHMTGRERLQVLAAKKGRLMSDTLSKIVSPGDLVVHVDSLRSQGKTIVFTNGCFDLLHVGHATYLQQASELGDVLAVAINADSSVRRLKGPGRPVINQRDRASLLAALTCVDFVVIFSDDSPVELLRQIRPDVLVKGGTYTIDQIVGKEVVEAYGGKVFVVGRVPGVSTSAIVATLGAN